MPTIGNTTEFANYDFSWGAGDGGNEQRGIKITMTENGTATDIACYAAGIGSSEGLLAALYDSSLNLLGSGTTTGAFNEEQATISLTEETSGSLDLTSGNTYVLTITPESFGAVANDGSSNTAFTYDVDITYPTPADPLTNESQNQPDYSIWLIYTASGGGSDPSPNLESAVGDMTAIRATTFTYDFTSHFSDSQSLAYTVTGAPSGWDLDASAGTVTYTHVGADVSNSPFTPHVIATDTEGNAVTSSFTLTVRHPKMAFESSASTQIIERSNGALLSRTLHYQIMGSADPVGYAGNYDDGSATFASGEYTFTLTSVDISAGEQGAIVLYDPNDGDTRRYVLSAF